jgi:anti-sigma factor RsiW
MNPSMHEHDVELLQAYADGELDPATATSVERRFTSDVGLRARFEAILSLRRLIHTINDDDVPLDRLRSRVAAAVKKPTIERRKSWQAIAAAAMIGAVISATVTFIGVRQDPAKETSDFAVANHIRSLLAAQPFDIASSDRHTIKPWFTTKLPESPPIVDLSNDGFPLAGGRIDVVVHDPAPTVVYRHGQHAISLTTLRGLHPVSSGNISGYNVSTWRDGNFTYIAVSDLPVADLDDFRHAFMNGISR